MNVLLIWLIHLSSFYPMLCIFSSFFHCLYRNVLYICNIVSKSMQQMYNKTRTCAIAKKRYSFKKGYLQVSLEEKDKLKNDLKVVLNNPSRSYFSKKLNSGIIDISVTLFTAITNVFQKYGITDCWTIEEM